MATKLQFIGELSNRTIKSFSDKPSNWTSFLKTASWNYKYPFHEQLLIYAQRPNATACASFDMWNNHKDLRRSINRGAKGIALIREKQGEIYLAHVFDVADTNSRYGEEIRLWKNNDRYEDDIVETLKNAFGDDAEQSDLINTVFSVSAIAATDNKVDYLQDLRYSASDSFLSDYDELNLDVKFQTLLQNSVAYMVLNRLGYNAEEYFEAEDFQDITDFNTPETIAILGMAASDISEVALRSIETTVKEKRREEIAERKKFANSQKIIHNTVVNKNTERNDDYGNDVQSRGRISDTRLRDTADTADRQVRNVTQNIHQDTQKGDVLPADGESGINGLSTGHRQQSERTSGTDRFADGGNNENARQGNRPNGLGGNDEQSQTGGGGNRDGGVDLQLGLFPTVAQQQNIIEEAEQKNKGSAFSMPVSQEDIDSILQDGSDTADGKYRIYSHFIELHTQQETVEFLKNEYGIGGRTFDFPDGTRGGHQHNGKGIHIGKYGSEYTNPDITLSWEKVAKRLKELISIDRYLNNKEKEHLPIYQQEIAEKRLAAAEEQHAKDILSQVPPENKEYSYHLGDTVYIGNAEYEVLAFDYTIVRLYDSTFPMFNKEIAREEFDRKIRENPNNDHLIVVEGITEVADDKAAEKPLSSWEQYQKIKSEQGENVLVLFQVGDFFEAYGADTALPVVMFDIALIERIIDGEKYAMCGFPSHSLDEYVKRLTESGVNVAVATREQDGTYTVKNIPDNRTPEISEDEKPPQNEIDAYKALVTETAEQSEEIPIGREITIDDRKFVIESVNDVSGNISLRDITFENGNGYPIFRSEKKDFILRILDEGKTIPIIPSWEKPKKSRINTYDIHPEIPNSERHTFQITDDNLGVGGAKEKYKNNIAAINTLHNIEFDNRFATPEEQEILSKYVGWGGLADAFDEGKPNWANEFIELYTVLSPDEYKSARESTLNAHYTCPVVIKAMYQALENMGFTTGNILEPSCGIGNFMGLVPESMQDSKIYGIELDSVTGRIAQQLYQKTSVAVQGYEDTALPDSFFDVAIGNVPFGNYKILEKKYDKNNFLIHDFFFAKTLDKVRPGGVIAFITSSGTMDKKNPAIRKYIAQRADLLGAIRLPNNAFLANAGTQVTGRYYFLAKT